MFQKAEIHSGNSCIYNFTLKLSLVSAYVHWNLIFNWCSEHVVMLTKSKKQIPCEIDVWMLDTKCVTWGSVNLITSYKRYSLKSKVCKYALNGRFHTVTWFSFTYSWLTAIHNVNVFYLCAWYLCHESVCSLQQTCKFPFRCTILVLGYLSVSSKWISWIFSK